MWSRMVEIFMMSDLYVKDLTSKPGHLIEYCKENYWTLADPSYFALKLTIFVNAEKLLHNKWLDVPEPVR